MTRATVGLTNNSIARRRPTLRMSATTGAVCLALVLGACGGGDDDDPETTSPTSDEEAATATTIASAGTIAPATTTLPPTTTTLPALELVTEGATVVVANASGIDGAAGRMTDILALAGFSTGAAANSSEDQLSVTKVYVVPDDPEARAVADSLRLALGGGAIEVLDLGTPAPLGDPDALGDATIVMAMGNDTADKSLDELQGRVAPAAEESTGESTGDESTGESSGEESTTEESSGESTTDASDT